MESQSTEEQAIELLQQLGLKEYEARTFVALARLPQATAKEISEHSTVPRTRVYDAVRVLESKGLVETQHSTPQQFRAIAIDEAVESLKGEYESRTEDLHTVLENMTPATSTNESGVTHEIWAMKGNSAIKNRTSSLVENAKNEIFFIIGHPSVVTDSFIAELESAQDRGVALVIGTTTDELREKIMERFPDASVFLSDLTWLEPPSDPRDVTNIHRMLLVDQETILVSTSNSSESHGGDGEKAIFGRGFDNGLVTIARRMMSAGLSENGTIPDETSFS